jgi:hypothetical protein
MTTRLLARLQSLGEMRKHGANKINDQCTAFSTQCMISEYQSFLNSQAFVVVCGTEEEAGVAVYDLGEQAPADLISLSPPLHTRLDTRQHSADTSSGSMLSLKDLVARGLFARGRPRAMATRRASNG